MSNKEKYKKSVDKIKPSDDLVNETINLIKEKKSKKGAVNFMKNRKLITAASLLLVIALSTGTFIMYDNKTNKNISSQSEKLIGRNLTKSESEKEYKKFLEDSKLNNLTEEKGKVIEISINGKSVATEDFYTFERMMLYMNVLNEYRPISKFNEKKEYTEDEGYKYLYINKDDSIILTIYDKYRICIPDKLGGAFVVIDLTKKNFTFYKVYVNHSREYQEHLNQLITFITSKYEQANAKEENNNINEEEPTEENKDNTTNDNSSTNNNNNNSSTNNNNNNSTNNNNNDTQPVIKRLYGDVNRDGKINSRDVSMIKRYVMGTGNSGLTGDVIDLADVNGDGEITKLDAVLLNYTVVKLIPFDGTKHIKTPTMYGDLSNSGEIEQYDYELLKGYLEGSQQLNQQLKKNADINEDGKIDNTDLLILEARLKGIIVKENLLTPVLEYTLYGDANQDGKITSHDATWVKRYLAGLTILDPQAKKNADVNQDGKIDETDAKLIQEFVVKMHEGTLPFKPIK